ATVTGSATRPLLARPPIQPAPFVPTPTPAALTNARTPLVRRWTTSRVSQIAALPPHYDAPTATALTQLSTRAAPLVPPPSVILPLHPPPETTWTKQRTALL